MTTQRHMEKFVCRQTQRLEWCLYKVRSSWGFWKLEEVRKYQPLGVSRKAWLCQHLNFRLLTSRTVRPRISIVLTHSLCHFVMGCPRKPVIPVFSCSLNHLVWNMSALGPDPIVFVFYDPSALFSYFFHRWIRLQKAGAISQNIEEPSALRRLSYQL